MSKYQREVMDHRDVGGMWLMLEGLSTRDINSMIVTLARPCELQHFEDIKFFDEFEQMLFAGVFSKYKRHALLKLISEFLDHKATLEAYEHAES